MNNLLIDPYGKDLLILSSGFHFPPLLDLLLSDYPAVQNLTLDVLTRLTEWRTDNYLQELFLNSGGVQKVLDTIEVIHNILYMFHKVILDIIFFSFFLEISMARLLPIPYLQIIFI